MRRISILVLMLFACLASVAWAQQTSVPRFSKHPISGHRHWIGIPNKSDTAIHSSAGTEMAALHHTKVWDLGTYPGGTWADVGGANDFGVAVAEGDTDSDSATHLFTIQLFGPRAPQWSDLGAINAYAGWFLWPAIADTGTIVGSAATDDGYVHAFAWAKKSGRIDLGALSALGYNFSVAERVNKLGTLIVGWSGDSSDNSGSSLPVVWTPTMGWTPDGWMIVWKIRALDTSGFEGFHHWMVYGVNDFGQLSGMAWDDSDPETGIGVIWNPLPNGKGWKIVQIPGSSEYPNVEAGAINDQGEVAGDVDSSDWNSFSAALWKPVDRQRTVYKLVLLPSLPGSTNGGSAEGINDAGDLVGFAFDSDWNMLAAQWSTKDPTFVRQLGFPGTLSLANNVNDSRIVTGLYRIDDTDYAYAVQLP